MRHVVLVLGVIVLLLSGCVTIQPPVSSMTSPTTIAQDIDESRRLQQEGEQAFNAGEYAKAEILFWRVLPYQEKALGSEHVDTVRSIFYLGAALQGQGKNAEAAALLRRSSSVELLFAINDGNAKRALTLLERGANPNARNPRGFSALMYAGRAGQTRVIKALLDKGADANTGSSDGTTALIESVKFGDPEAVRLLLSRVADVNTQDGKGESALRWAQKRLADAPEDRSLLSDLPERTEYGDLAFATKKELREIVEMLKRAGAKE